MKILEKIKNNLKSIKRGVRDYPISLILSLILSMLFIYSIELSYGGKEPASYIQRLEISISLALVFSIAIGLLIKSKDSIRAYARPIYLGLFILTGLYYKYAVGEFLIGERFLYFGLLLFAVVLVFYIGRLTKAEGYEFYFIDLVSAILVSLLNSLVLYFGLVFIIFTISQLFNVDIGPERYIQLYVAIFNLVFLAIFIGNLPDPKKDYGEGKIGRVLKGTISYILIPLTSIYTLILYAYFIKIIISSQWPRGLVSHLVIWYSIVGVFIIFITRNIREENILMKSFYRYFSGLNIPLLLLMFYSIYLRINQYGFTENRYYLLLAGIWLLSINVLKLLNFKGLNLTMPLSLSFLILISTLGPLSSRNVAFRSQNRRLKNLLVDYGIYKEGRIRPKKDLSYEKQSEINNIMDYMEESDFIARISYLPKDYSLDKQEDYLGFKYENDYRIVNNYINYYNVDGPEIVDIADYDQMINYNTNLGRLELEDLSLEIKGYRLELIFKGKSYSVDLEQDLSKIFHPDRQENGPIVLDYSLEKGGALKIIINSFNAERLEGRIERKEMGLKVLLKEED